MQPEKLTEAVNELLSSSKEINQLKASPYVFTNTLLTEGDFE